MWWVGVVMAAEPVDPFKEPDESALFRFEESLVTVASRYAQTLRHAPSIISVLTADEIRERGMRTLSDALRELPGVYIWRSPEGRDLAAIRGIVSADNNKLLILVDGVPWYEGVYTHGFLDEYLPISHIRQIEVIKGPGSAIYGTNALMGVVNVVTFKGDDVEGVKIRWFGGSVSRSDTTVVAGDVVRIGSQSANVSTYARVFSETGEGLSLTPEREIDAPGTDPSKGVAVGFNVSVAGIEAQLHHVDYSHTYLLNSRQDPYGALGRTLDTFDLQYHATIGELRLRWAPGSVEFSPYAWFQRHDNPGSYFFGGDITLSPGDTPDSLQATTNFVTVDAEKRTGRTGFGLDFQGRLALDHTVLARVGFEGVSVHRFFDYAVPTEGDPFVLNGFAITDDCGQVTGLYGNDQRCARPRLRNLFGVVQYTWTVAPSVEITASARVDKRIPTNRGERPSDGAFVLAVSPRLGILWVPTDRLTAKFLYGRGFRAPSVRELLVIVPPDEEGAYPFTSGNLSLRPESLHNAEAELTADLTDAVTLRADGYWSLFFDEIDKVAPGLYCNLPGPLSAAGIELGARGEVGRFRLGGDYSLTSSRYGAAKQFDPAVCDIPWDRPYANRPQYEFPPQMVKAQARAAVTEHVSTTLFAEWYAARPRRVWSPDALANDGRAFALVHASAEAGALGPGGALTVGLTVRNALDARWNTGVYRDAINDPDNQVPIAGPGRAVLVSVEGRL